MEGGAAPAAGEGVLELRCEARADEGHFDEGAHRAKVEAAVREAAACRAREAAALERLRRTEREADERAAEVLAAVAAEQQRRTKTIAELREQAHEEDERGEDLLEDCARDIQAIEQQIEAERARRLGVEAALKDERQQFEKATRHEAELQESEREAVRAKEDRMRQLQSEGQARIVAAQRASEARVREAEARARQEIDAIEQEIQQSLLQQRGATGAEVSLRRDTINAVDKEVSARVDTQVRQALLSNQREAEDIHFDAYQQVKDIRSRDVVLDTLVQQHALAQEALEGAQRHMHQAAITEKVNKDKAEAATQLLGPVHHRSTQFSLPGPPRKALPPGPLGLSAQAIVASPACD